MERPSRMALSIGEHWDAMGGVMSTMAWIVSNGNLLR